MKIECVGTLGSGVGQGRVSDPYELVEDAESSLGARGVTGYVGEIGLSSISLPEACSESDSTEIALPLPLFHGEYWENVRLETDLGDSSYGEVGEGSLGGGKSWGSWDSFACFSCSKYSLSCLSITQQVV